MEDTFGPMRPDDSDEAQARFASLSPAERESLRVATIPVHPATPRWPSGVSSAMRGNVCLTYLVRGASREFEQGTRRADCSIMIEEHAVLLGAVHIGAFRRAADEILAERGIDSKARESGIVVVELHPASVTDDGQAVVSQPETDDRLLRHIAGYHMFPAHWTVTTTSRNYMALVGEGDLVVVAWSGNFDFWKDDTRDRVFQEFGDHRTLDVVWQTLGASTAMNFAYSQLHSIRQQLEEINRIVTDSSGSLDQLRKIGEVHRRIQQTRSLVNQAVLLPSTGLKVSGDSTLRRLAGLHLELAQELIPQRMTRELERELDGLLHDVEFAMSQRSDEGLRQVIHRLGGLLEGSREEKRVRFVQSVVLLILAGAALFTGIMSIPGTIFPATYPTAALWAVLIVLSATGAGLILFWAYQHKIKSRPWIPRAIGALVAAFAAVAWLGLAQVLQQRQAMLLVLTLSFVAAALGALDHNSDPA